MATFSRNLFSVLGEEETETDKLGNTKPKDKKVDETTPRSKREAARKLHTRVAGNAPLLIFQLVLILTRTSSITTFSTRS